MTLAELKAQHPEALQEYKAELAASFEAGFTARLAESEKTAGTAEREKVLALAESLLGAEAVAQLTELAACGVSPEQATKLRKLFGQTLTMQSQVEESRVKLDAMKAAHVPATGLHSSLASTPTASAEKPDFSALVAAHMKEHSVSRGEAMKAMAVAYPEEHKLWLAAQQKG